MRCKAARHRFSLMEVMIVILLVGVIGSVSAFSLWPFYQSYHFRLEVETLYELIQELQLEAMTLQSDMKLSFTKQKGKWVARTSSDEPILKSQTIDLTHVDQISEVPEIRIYSHGIIEPSKIIKLSNKSDNRWIDLRGGHLIKLCETMP